MNKNEAQIKFILGLHLYLRPVLKRDFPELLIWMNDREVLQYLTMYFPMTEIMEMDWIERKSVSENEIVLAIVLNNGELIGTIGLHNISWKDRLATSGCCIGNKKYWNNGYGTEAKMLLFEYAFNTLNIRKISSYVYSNNPRSKRYQEKCGGVQEGVMRAQTFHNGEYLDHIIMGTFREDFLEIWEAQKERYLP